MMNVKQTNVPLVLEMLLEELGDDITRINDIMKKALDEKNYAAVDAVREQITHFVAFHEKVATLQSQWQQMVSVLGWDEDESAGVPAERHSFGRLPPGELTPLEAYWIPILETLVEQGGSGRVGDIIERVEQKIADVLNETDREPKPSNPNEPRWRNRRDFLSSAHPAQS